MYQKGIISIFPDQASMTYRLQYSASEHQSLLASALERWTREDKDLRLISNEGHVIYTRCFTTHQLL